MLGEYHIFARKSFPVQLVAKSAHNVDIPVPVKWQGKMYVSMVPSTIKVDRRFISEADTVMFACTVHEGRNLTKHSTHKQKLPWVLVKVIKIPILAVTTNCIGNTERDLARHNTLPQP